MNIAASLPLAFTLVAEVQYPPAPNAAGPAKCPNIILFLTDDLGWADTASFGSDVYETANADRPAADGVRFIAAYAAGNICSPTHATLMTGIYPARTLVTDWIDGMWDYLSLEQRKALPLLPPDWTQHLELPCTTLARALRPNGYRTAFVGNWRPTPTSDDPAVVEAYHPNRHGFDLNIAGNQWGAPGNFNAHPFSSGAARTPGRGSGAYPTRP